ncbi:carbon storage regulator [Bacillus sp. EB01]|uniref:carbon storage regulator n=1 Tax=Bacillus sp. EB01 TaxID=1347086 RepID=UPI0005C6B312|nr:carbon storage regulator [Bacillus sp. EB01]
MLIIGREIGQSVIIDGDVKVTAVQFASKLRLTVDAPENIQVTRSKPEPARIFKKKLKSISETVQIGDSIKVTILLTETGLLRLAIDAPREIRVYREELYLQEEIQIS